ncbi:hypothetical protein CFC21_071516 [Triticum aestivum]|uniref:F-box domain-containing protein n=2 Tax=Triticum aestivum TaxID=4565 RepID=A0A9R1HGB3_WHEAT|nr:uncharacterized protein LOC123143680 [Triticum aestivum]KAF7065412.1 hypothetical protein CFC21_071516 [Triticum aestivum]
MAPPASYIVNEILEEIFLRLPTPAALVRASTASPRFRRIITGRSFLRRFRALHPPPLVGFALDKHGFHHAQEPHPSAPLARALADRADFTYSFVPKPNDDWLSGLSPWCHRDVRDGRVLLECSYLWDIEPVFTHLAVCDPWSRRSTLLFPIPEEMTVQQERLIEFEPMLAPIGEDEDENEDETSFKVICTARYETKLVTFVYSSVAVEWCIAASPSWNSLGTDEPPRKGFSHFNYLRGCFYWSSLWKDKLLVLDTRTMEFSTANILTGYHVQLINQPGQSVCMSTIVDGTKGALEMFTLVGHCKPTSFYIYHTSQQNNGGPSKEWQLKNVIALPPRCLYYTVGATEGFLFLRGVREARWDDNRHGVFPVDNDVDFFSLDVKTSELKKVCSCRATIFDRPNRAHPLFGFPPSLSKPSL